MRKLVLGWLWLGFFVAAPTVEAQSMWERRDPQSAYLFVDTRARHVGDLLTVFVNESTEVEGFDKKSLDKETTTSGSVVVDTAMKTVNMMKQFTGSADSTVSSQRKFDGQANTSIDRKLVDRLVVVVVCVLPNGNLVIEGRRTRIISKEARTLVVRGIVRPIDIGAGNIVQSQFIANFYVNYEGKGPESSYTNHGWMGQIFNKIWPF
jgi:flagellar L-ring protein precursor FlgH